MKPRGRPKLAAESVDVHFRLSVKEYEQTFAQAQRERLTLSEWIRQSIRQGHRRNSVEQK